MRPFYEDSSAAKTLTNDIDIHFAVRHMSEFHPDEFELRKYNRDGSYELLDTFVTRKGAEVAKSFADLELGQPTCIVAVYKHPYIWCDGIRWDNEMFKRR